MFSTFKYGSDGDATMLVLDFYGWMDDYAFRLHLSKVMTMLTKKGIHIDALLMTLPGDWEQQLEGFKTGGNTYGPGEMISLELPLSVTPTRD